MTITVAAQRAATATPEQNPPGTFQYGSEQQKIRAVEAALVAGGGVTAIVAALLPLLYGTGVTVASLTAAVRLVRMRLPQGAGGPAGKVMGRQLVYYQAAQILHTAIRLATELDQGMPARLALQREQRFLEQHREAQQRRLAAADAIDQVCGGDGTVLLVWDAELDKRTTPECAAADGGTFTADQPPAIGYPGTVHMHCRCRARKAVWVGPTVDQLVGAATALRH